MQVVSCEALLTVEVEVEVEAHVHIAHLADFRFVFLASTFSVRPPQNPKNLGFRAFSPFALRWCGTWCRRFGLTRCYGSHCKLVS